MYADKASSSMSNNADVNTVSHVQDVSLEEKTMHLRIVQEVTSLLRLQSNQQFGFDICDMSRMGQTHGVQAAWEKLHTGIWKHVHMAWRDMYSLGCLLLSLLDLASVDRAASLPPAASALSEGSTEQQNGDGITSTQAATGLRTSESGSSCGEGVVSVSEQQARLAAAMRELDLAVIMGGLRFRPWVEAAIELVQQRYVQLAGQALSGIARKHGAGKQGPSRGYSGCSDSAEPERPTKVRRTLHNGDCDGDRRADEEPLAEQPDGDICGERGDCWPARTARASLPAGG